MGQDWDGAFGLNSFVDRAEACACGAFSGAGWVVVLEDAGSG